MSHSKKNAGGYPGMLDFLYSLLPWVALWLLGGVTNLAMLIIPVAISAMIAVHKFSRKQLNWLDAATDLFLAAFILAAIIGKSDSLLRYSAVWGSIFLLTVTVAGLLAGKAVTAGYTKKDNPNTDEHNYGFIEMNKILSIAWAAVFGLHAVLFFILPHTAAFILSVIVILLTGFLSIAFTFTAPVLFHVRDFKRNDWPVNLDRNKPLQPGEYDVIIAGAGIGGLACAALLSKRGYRVAVFEHQYHVGGFCSSFSRRGFTFNTGVEDVSGLGDNGPISFLLKELGLNKEELFVRNTTRYFFKGRDIDVPSETDEFIQVLSGLFPEESRNLSLFFSDAKAAYDECYRDAAVHGIIFPPELTAKRFGLMELLSYPVKRKHAYGWMQPTYREKLDEYFTNEDLKTILSALMVYMGTEPHNTQAVNALAACLTFCLNGGYSVKGGAQAFADALKDFIERNNGKIFLNTMVEKILVENGRVKGIQTKDGLYSSPIVVSNVDAKSTFNDLVGSAHLDHGFLQEINSQKMSTSFFLLYLGVDMDLSEYPILLKNIEEGWEVTINSNADKSMSPPGKASMTVLLDKDIRYGDFPDRRSPEYAIRKEELSVMLIDRVEKYIPGLRERIVFREAATPKTFERYNLMPEGAVYSLDQSIETKRPFFKTPVKGLYLAGASVFPGAGVEPAIVSGAICANDICNWKKE